jgi:NAD(P)-dependent dehydrogenase (short-subunit alcohol dehydrogenase family)
VILPTDLARPDECRALVDDAVAALGGIDAVVHDAGITMHARFDEVRDLSLYETLMRVNYLGPVHVTHRALPHLRARRGLVVAVSSLLGLTGAPTRTGYAASKHALQGFMDSLRLEVAADGIDVLVVSPGFVATGIRARAAMQPWSRAAR